MSSYYTKSSRRDRRRNKSYSIKKTGIKDEYIDRQIIAIHRAIAIKLLANLTLVEQVKLRLATFRELGKLNYSQFINWYSIIEMIDEPETFLNAMIEDSPYMRKLRRKTHSLVFFPKKSGRQRLSKMRLVTLRLLMFCYSNSITEKRCLTSKKAT